MPVARHCVGAVLPPALEMIPSGAHEAEFSGLVVDDPFEFKLKEG